MQTNNLQRKTKLVTSAQVGRGGTRGKTSGRGTKGQKARAGNKVRPQMRDTIKKLPKLRGRGKHSNKSITDKFYVVKYDQIELVIDSGKTITPEVLFEHKLVKKSSGTFPKIKILGILGGHTPTKKYSFEKVKVSQKLKDQLEKAGSSFK